MSKPTKRLFIPLATRLTVPIVLLVAGVAIVAYLGITRTSRVTAMRSKEVAADMVIKLTSLSVMPAVVFADDVEMKRAIEDLGKNPEITDVELWSAGADATKPIASLHRNGGRALGRPKGHHRERALEHDSVRAVEPVISPDGKTIAMLSARFSTARESAALAEITKQILYASIAIAVLLVAALLFVLTRLVVSPIRRLQRAAERLASGGDREQVAVIAAPARVEDEVVRLATAFGDMAAAVRDREARLAVRNGELRLILDSVDQGFLTARPDGSIQPERSAIIARWFGDLPNDLHVWDLAERIDPTSRSWAKAAWLQALAGFLPLEVAMAQLPKRLVRAGSYFDFAYHPVMSGEEIDSVVIVLTDVTAEVERQRALAEQHEFSVLVDQFVRDRRAFLDFWNEASALIKRITEAAYGTGHETLRRDVHTLKGNARFFGLTRLGALCHELEDAMQERGENTLTTQERAELAASWAALSQRIEPIIHGATAFVEISEEEYGRLLDALVARAPLERVEELVRGLRHEPTEWRLTRARDTLLAICEKLGKSAPRVTIDHGDLRLPPGRWAPFWSVVPHLINNVADHGLETDDERSASGKPLPAEVRMRTRIQGGEFIVELSDDGRGIDWERVRKRAEERSLPSQSQRDLEQALFSEGLSLKERVTDVSGRGVGLAAVRTVVAAMSGRIELESKLGRGTTFRFRFAANFAGETSEPKKGASIERPPLAS